MWRTGVLAEHGADGRVGGGEQTVTAQCVAVEGAREREKRERKKKQGRGVSDEVRAQWRTKHREESE